MINVLEILSSKLSLTVRTICPESPTISCLVTSCHDLRFGDYQSNVAMILAKTLGKSPHEIAGQIISQLKVENICSKIEIAGAGFINFHLTNDFIVQQLTEMFSDKNDGILVVASPHPIVIDFSSPNIAKSMHVGHIRSTFLGDTLARISRAVGHRVITDNHLGDWGTQFGKLIYGYKHLLDKEALLRSSIAEFERLYKEAHALSESDPQALEMVRQELGKLQSGDPENTKIWKEISEQSLAEFKKAYERMGVSFDHQLGESFYHSLLQKTVDELKHLGIAEISEGATCIFFPEDPELKEAAPMIIQKSDDAFLYATTDLATVYYRVKEWHAEIILYVTDSRQRLHFKQLFAAVHRWFAKQNSLPVPRLQHVIFGSILGADKRPIKTRSGDPIKLSDLLDEAEARALKIIQEKNPNLSESEHRTAARVLGIGALKYADLCQNRNLDYIFDWNKLLALQGNTAPYLIYAYVRVRSIFRSVPEMDLASLKFSSLETTEEVLLGKHLIQLSDTVHSVLEDHRPHLLTHYLYELACKFSKFYEACPVLKAAEPQRSSRLALCHLTARTLKKGLNLLGIETLEKM